MKLVYDGGNIIGQSNGTTLGRRYVAAPGSDEVLVEYKVSNGTKDYKLTDERGSVIATTDASGNGASVNSYDEYGIPGSGNVGRFQYTGQFYLAELGLQYSKARMYAPGLGRFLQTDPIGYGDGLNWYNYVKGDPVNWSDPGGLEIGPIIIHCRTDCGPRGRGLNLPGLFQAVGGAPQSAPTPDDGSAVDATITATKCNAVCEANKDYLAYLAFINRPENRFSCYASSNGISISICTTHDDYFISPGFSNPGLLYEYGIAPGGADNFLRGLSGNARAGIAGPGFSFSNGLPKSLNDTAFIFGTSPGMSVSYGISINDLLSVADENLPYDTGDRIMIPIVLAGIVSLYNCILGYRWSKLQHNPWKEMMFKGNFISQTPGLSPADMSIEEINRRGRRLIKQSLILGAVFSIFVIAYRILH